MLHHDLPQTPAFVYDLKRIRRRVELLAELRDESGCRPLFSIKALPLGAVLREILPGLAGFSVSSLFEARLARSVTGATAHSLHIATPGFRPDEIAEIAELCDHISFNSLEQWRRLTPLAGRNASIGLRVNPELSYIDDPRYDPCRAHSKLGVPLGDLTIAIETDRDLADGLEGIHFHSAFGSCSFEPLRRALERIEQALGPNLARLRWINLGGGYLFDSAADLAPLADLVSGLRQRFGLEVFFEPGNALVGAAGRLVSTVIDRFERDGKSIAVLDTGVHHLPEVFEYQKSPVLEEHCPDGEYAYLLAGSSCLAGDLFGEYRFAAPLQLGDRLSFLNVGAYSLVKASNFNGYDLPAVYAERGDGRLELLKRFGFEDYFARWG